MSDAVVEIIFKWLLQNIDKFVDKKEDVVHYAPVTLTYYLGQPKLLLSDPELLEVMHNDKSVMQKNSSVAKYMMTSCITNNVFTMDHGPDQMARRKEIIHMFTGKANF